MLAFICWVVQFYQYLLHNVLTVEDRERRWYSTGLSELGFSFYLIVIGIAVVILNLSLIFTAIALERRDTRIARSLDPAYDEKIQGAIMLY